MSDPYSKCYTLKQRAFIVEYYFRSNVYQTTLQLYKKQFHDTPDVRTMKCRVTRCGGFTPNRRFQIWIGGLKNAIDRLRQLGGLHKIDSGGFDDFFRK